MTVTEKQYAEALIQTVALRNNTTPEEVRSAIQEALDAAWAEAWRPGNIHAQVRWQQLFPGPRKPAVEEFIVRMSESLGTKNEEAK